MTTATSKAHPFDEEMATWTSDKVDEYLSKKISVELLYNAMGPQAILVAAYFSKLEDVHKLVSLGVSINFQSEKGWTPLMCAAAKGVPQFLDFVMHVQGIDFSKRNNHGLSAVEIVAFMESDELNSTSKLDIT